MELTSERRLVCLDDLVAHEPFAVLYDYVSALSKWLEWKVEVLKNGNRMPPVVVYCFYWCL